MSLSHVQRILSVIRPLKSEHIPLNDILIEPIFTSALGGEATGKDRSRQPHEVRDAAWSPVDPLVPSAPQLIAWSAEMADLLELDIESHKETYAKWLTGQHPIKDAVPYAMRYGGHQFGNWAGQLGDGRAIALGEMKDRNNQHWTLQLKGAGPTPYSRQGDGFAVLRSSVREYLCSEAMHHLHIPTTRSVTLCLTGEDVDRDIFYDGNINTEAGAILCRAAQSFVRFGSFEIHAAYGETDQLRELANYVIKQHYSHIWPDNQTPGIDIYQQWFSEVLTRTAHLIADWQRVGFVHAVMNTDNMSILGQTIDYGPYGWLEEYDPTWTPNFVDRHGRRYSYRNQPQIGLWNLYRLANAVLPLFDDQTEPLEDILGTYNDTYNEKWNNISANKIGISSFNAKSGDGELLNNLWSTLEQSGADFTIFFRLLATVDTTDKPETMFSTIAAAFYDTDKLATEVRASFMDWLSTWAARISDTDQIKQRDLMNATNPKYVLRNYIAQLCIDAAERGDYSVINDISTCLRNPYDDQPNYQQYAQLRPEWASNRPGCTTLTCSS